MKATVTIASPQEGTRRSVIRTLEDVEGYDVGGSGELKIYQTMYAPDTGTVRQGMGSRTTLFPAGYWGECEISKYW